LMGDAATRPRGVAFDITGLSLDGDDSRV
jgi:hypothetical protein